MTERATGPVLKVRRPMPFNVIGRVVRRRNRDLVVALSRRHDPAALNTDMPSDEVFTITEFEVVVSSGFADMRVRATGEEEWLGERRGDRWWVAGSDMIIWGDDSARTSTGNFDLIDCLLASSWLEEDLLLDSGIATTMAGRPALKRTGKSAVGLVPGLPILVGVAEVFEVCVDQRTGSILRARSLLHSGTLVSEVAFSEFTTVEQLPDDVFTWEWPAGLPLMHCDDPILR